MSNINKAYNLSVRDDTTFRVESGEGDIGTFIRVINSTTDDIAVVVGTQNEQLFLSPNEEAFVDVTPGISVAIASTGR